MNVYKKHLWSALKLILLVGTPVQSLIDKGGSTHLFLDNQALTMLQNDGKQYTYNIINNYRAYIDLGNIWADKGWKSFAHYYVPGSGKGIFHWVSAVTEGNNYFEEALCNWKMGKYQKSIFYLGAAAHIVQDVCVPHHAMGIAFNGHRNFENWVMENKQQFKVNSGGLYGQFVNIKELIKNNAENAKQYYSYVSEFDPIGYTDASSELLGLAQKTTAFLFDHFVYLTS